MLEIRESKDKTRAQEFVKEQGSDYNLSDDIVMVCADADEILGVSALSLRESKVYLDLLLTIETMGDLAFKAGLARAIMNLADLRGIKEIYGSCPELSELYEMLRFKKEEGEYRLSLDGYFTAGH